METTSCLEREPNSVDTFSIKKENTSVSLSDFQEAVAQTSFTLDIPSELLEKVMEDYMASMFID